MTPITNFELDATNDLARNTLGTALSDPSLKSAMESYYAHYYRDTLGLPDWEDRVRTRLDEEDSLESGHFRRAVQFYTDLDGKRFLNVGCGTGGMNLVAARSGMLSYGIETSTDALEICRAKARIGGIPEDQFKQAKAESLPFADNSFDFIYCLSVLEHVQDVQKAVHEMVRVAQPGGQIYIHSPNYLSFYETHYKIFWLPKFPKQLARIYLRLRGRSPDFINSLNYTTPTMIRRALQHQPVHARQGKRDLRWKGSRRAFLTNLFYAILQVQPVEFWITKT